MGLIFLDIDGVFVTHKNFARLKAAGEDYKEELPADHKSILSHPDKFCPECVSNFNRIVETTKADIVISSTWRKYYHIDDLRSLFVARGVKGRIISHTPYISEGCRGEEIDVWLRLNGPQKFVIIDDDSDMLPGQPHVKTSMAVGLTSELADKVIGLLA